jgi:hypothetical protein
MAPAHCSDDALRTFGVPGASTLDEWSSALRVADAWGFPAVRAAAVSALDALVADKPLERILRGRAHDLPGWADEGLVALCARTRPLDLAEAARLRTDDVLFVSKYLHKLADPKYDAEFHVRFPHVEKRDRLLDCQSHAHDALAPV